MADSDIIVSLNLLISFHFYGENETVDVLAVLAWASVCRKIGQLFLMLTKSDAIQGEGQLGKNDITWGKLTALVCHPTKKVNKAEKLTYLSTYFGHYLDYKGSFICMIYQCTCTLFWHGILEYIFELHFRLRFSIMSQHCV